MKPESKIRIMVVDDHFFVRIGLSTSINAEKDMMVVAEAKSGTQAVSLYRTHKPDVTLMDLRLPEMNGVEATAEIIKESPEARIIVISNYDGDEDIHKALKAGASSYLLKNMDREEVIDTIRAVALGQEHLPTEIKRRLSTRIPESELTARELEVLKLVAKGLSNKQIASTLSIAEITIKVHVSNIFTKLAVEDRTEAVTTALRRGIISLD
jgi:two-component system, NarL family, response regulator